MILERLVGGEWECALKLLELPEQDQWQEWQSSVQRGISPNRMRDIDFNDVTGMRQKLTSSLAHLPPELRSDIAKQLLAADGPASSRGSPHEDEFSPGNVAGRINKLEIRYGAAIKSLRRNRGPSGADVMQKFSRAMALHQRPTSASSRRRRGASASLARRLRRNCSAARPGTGTECGYRYEVRTP
jgi:hypothetical protein